MSVGLGNSFFTAADGQSIRKIITAAYPAGCHPTTLGANYTMLFQATAESAFTAARVIFLNYGSSAMTFGYAACATSNSASANGTSLTWLPLYFNQPTYVGHGLWQSANGTTRSVTVPAGYGGQNGNNNIPGMAASDWVSINSIARNDGGTLPLLQVRAWCAAGGTMLNAATGLAGANTDANGRITRVALVADTDGSKVTSAASNSMNPGEIGNIWTAPVIVQFRNAVRTVTQLIVGDSIDRGQSSSGVAMATASGLVASSLVSTESVPVQSINLSVSGAGANYIHDRAMLYLETLDPSVLLVPAGSVNDGSNIGSNYGSLMRVVDKAKSIGCVPVVMTIPPSGKNGQTETDRVAMNEWCRSMASASVFRLLDKDAILRSNADQSVIAAAYLSDDAVHPNAAGHNAVGSAYSSILQGIVSRSL